MHHLGSFGHLSISSWFETFQIFSFPSPSFYSFSLKVADKGVFILFPTHPQYFIFYSE